MSTPLNGDEIILDGIRYISAVHAAREFGVTNDYITQFCRWGKVDARRAGKSWYVRRDELKSFLDARARELDVRHAEIARARVDEYRRQEWLRMHVSAGASESSERYISAVDASKEFGVTNDYVTQWCRSGKLPCKRIGKNWYVRYESLCSLLVESEYAQSVRKTGLVQTRADEYRLMHTTRHSGASASFVFAPIQKRELPAAHIPAYTITPLAEFFHKLTALTLAFMLTFGTYALVDPRAAHFAGESAKDTARSLRTTYDSLTGGGVQNLVANVQSQVALAAENPSATFAAASAALTTSIPNAAASFARTVNSRINSLVYAIAFPQSLALFSGGTTGGSVAVNIAPYARPVRSIASNGASPAATGPTTVINNPIVQRTVEVQRIVAESGGITEEELNTRLNQLDNKLTSQIYSITAVGGSTPVASGGIVNMIAATNRIDQLSGAAITGGTITGTAISGGSISGTSVSATTLSASGDTSLSDTTVNGDLTVTGAVNFTGTPLTATDATFTSATTTNLFATSTTLVNATSTNFFATNASTTNSTSTSLYSSSLVAGNATSTSLFSTTASSTNLFSTNGNVGALSAGTLALTTALPVSSGGTGQTSFGQGWLSSNGTTVSASTSPTVNYITATSTSATSTFAGDSRLRRRRHDKNFRRPHHRRRKRGYHIGDRPRESNGHWSGYIRGQCGRDQRP